MYLCIYIWRGTRLEEEEEEMEDEDEKERDAVAFVVDVSLLSHG